MHVFRDPDRSGTAASARTGRMSAELGVAPALAKVACDHDRLDRSAVGRAVLTRTIAGLVAGGVVANLVLVPAFGARGAALAFLITDSLLLAVFFAVLPAPGPVGGAELSTVAVGRGKTAPHGDAPGVRLDRGGPLSR